MTSKTHKTAVVLIPPEECWEPIQAIRREHDRQVGRWMPHVTLLYPFRPREQFTVLEDRLRSVCTQIEPFEVRLGEFHHFHHSRGRYTLWLGPEPSDTLVSLQAAVESIVPDCNEVSRHANGFTPHLSVGQVTGHDMMAGLKASLEGSWRPLSFRAHRISVIWRGDPPDDVFRVDRSIDLGV
ncbi:MAG: 2'-5' RNA ligase family protein [Planctomycetota bacterium]|jgi:2'-5' RNA ligase